MRKNIVILISILFIASCAHVTPQTSTEDDLISIGYRDVLAIETLNRPQIISGTFESYTFFLFPDRQWIQKNKSRELHELFITYKDFGDAIGPKNLAIWFNDKGVPDVNRSLDFVKMFDLSVNSGPYIVYIKPQLSTIKNIIVRSSGTGEDALMLRKALREMAEEGAFEKVVIDFNQCGRENTYDYINIMKAILRNHDTLRLNDQFIHCDARFIVVKGSCYVKKIMAEFTRYMKKASIFGSAEAATGTGSTKLGGKVGIDIVFREMPPVNCDE
jgi:hypothetical protein